MPVRFKGGTEYDTQYKPLQSYKSTSFKPEPEQLAPLAGKESTKLAVTLEPPLQRKKRVSGPVSSLSLEGGLPCEEDYALLGQQEKFTNNVRYRLKKSQFTNGRDASPAKQQKLMDEGNIKQRKSSKSAAAPPAPAPAPTVDTSKYAPPAPAPHPTVDTSKYAPPAPAPAPTVDTSKYAGPVTPLAPRKPREERSMLLRQLEADQNLNLKDQVSKPLKDKLGGQTGQSMEVRHAQTATKLNIPPDASKHNMSNKMNEFAQTNMDKKLAISGPEAPADYALRYKTKVAPPRPGRKQSEYQREFNWKNGFPASPLLDAEQAAQKKDKKEKKKAKAVIHNSNEGVVQGKPDLIPKESEYQRQFRQWKHQAATPAKSAGEPKKRRHKVQRSKSMSELNPEQIVAAGSAPVTCSDDKRLLRESLPRPASAQVLESHGKLKRAATEYRNNFKPPTRFSYEHGAWKGASPPHLLQSKEAPVAAAAEETTEPPPLSNWFAEVLELRRKAQEYKLRAQGTHFSREHLVQLLADQTKCWDQASTVSSTLSALSLESSVSSVPKEEKRVSRATRKPPVDIVPVAGKPSEAARKKQAWTREREEPEYPDNKSVMTTEAVAGSDMEEAVEEGEAPEETEAPSSGSTQVGRVPTPKFHRLTTPPRRHHLDLTTPTVGGAILSSPPRPKHASAFSVDLSDVSDPEPPRKPMTYNLNRLLTSPTLGHPTMDTHALRDDFALEDKPLSTQYIQSTQTTPVKRAEKFSRPAFPTLNENYGMTYNKRIPEVIQGPIFHEDDDNVSVLSESARSIASSCAAASELFERTKQRHETFWKSGKTVK